MKKNWVELYKKYGIYILLVVVFAFFAVAAPNFLAAKNVINILRQVSMFGIVVVGVCMVMIGGGMDLSVGMQMAVDGMLIGYMMVNPWRLLSPLLWVACWVRQTVSLPLKCTLHRLLSPWVLCWCCRALRT